MDEYDKEIAKRKDPIIALNNLAFYCRQKDHEIQVLEAMVDRLIARIKELTEERGKVNV